jgi:hypothetical protein
MQENYKNHSKPKAPGSWLTHAFSTDLLQKAKLLCCINQQFKKQLPQPMNQYCCLMNWTMCEVIIGVDSAEWLVSVRECEKSIRTCILAYVELPQTVKIKYLVRPQIAKAFIRKPGRMQMTSRISEQNRSILRTIASTVNDIKLKTTLLKLADD